MSEEGAGLAGMGGFRPLAQTRVMGAAHVCGTNWVPQRMYIIAERTADPTQVVDPDLEAPEGYHRYMVPTYPLLTSDGDAAYCSVCGEPFWLSVFGSTQWN